MDGAETFVTPAAACLPSAQVRRLASEGRALLLVEQYLVAQIGYRGDREIEHQGSSFDDEDRLASPRRFDLPLLW